MGQNYPDYLFWALWLVWMFLYAVLCAELQVPWDGWPEHWTQESRLCHLAPCSHQINRPWLKISQVMRWV